MPLDSYIEQNSTSTPSTNIITTINDQISSASNDNTQNTSLSIASSDDSVSANDTTSSASNDNTQNISFVEQRKAALKKDIIDILSKFAIIKDNTKEKKSEEPLQYILNDTLYSSPDYTVTISTLIETLNMGELSYGYLLDFIKKIYKNAKAVEAAAQELNKLQAPKPVPVPVPVQKPAKRGILAYFSGYSISAPATPITPVTPPAINAYPTPAKGKCIAKPKINNEIAIIEITSLSTRLKEGIINHPDYSYEAFEMDVKKDNLASKEMNDTSKSNFLDKIFELNTTGVMRLNKTIEGAKAILDKQITAKIRKVESDLKKEQDEKLEIVANLKKEQDERSKIESDLKKEQEEKSKLVGKLERTKNDLAAKNLELAERNLKVTSLEEQIKRVNASAKDLTEKANLIKKLQDEITEQKNQIQKLSLPRGPGSTTGESVASNMTGLSCIDGSNLTDKDEAILKILLTLSQPEFSQEYLRNTIIQIFYYLVFKSHKDKTVSQVIDLTLEEKKTQWLDLYANHKDGNKGEDDPVLPESEKIIEKELDAIKVCLDKKLNLLEAKGPFSQKKFNFFKSQLSQLPPDKGKVAIEAIQGLEQLIEEAKKTNTRKKRT